MTEVVVTGVGIVSPIGTGREQVWQALLDGRSGAGEITHFDASDLEVRIACEADGFDPSDYMDARKVRRQDRFSQMAIASALMAWEHAGLGPADPDRTGVILGSGVGGIITLERELGRMIEGGPRRLSPFTVPMLMLNGAAGAISMELGLRGPNFGVSSACATGGHAIGDALMYLQTGRADLMLAGSSEACISPIGITGFTRMGALSKRNDDPATASRPFHKDRDGFVVGEGAAVVVLETRAHADKRGATPLAVVAGYGASADAFHVTQPDPEGKGAVSAMRAAIADAGIGPEDLSYINAHGTSTPHNDRVETTALKELLGTEAKRIPVSSTKSQIGHLLGAAGAVEAVVTTMVIEGGVIPGTINLDDPDPDCDLDYVADGARKLDVEIAMSNSFGFGGQNAVLVLRKPR